MHKGIDIFGERGTEVVTASPGVVVYRGQLKLGGNVVYILGPKWRIHYYAHMDSVGVQLGDSVYAGKTIGTVGTSGSVGRRRFFFGKKHGRAGRTPPVEVSLLRGAGAEKVHRPGRIRFVQQMRLVEPDLFSGDPMRHHHA